MERLGRQKVMPSLLSKPYARHWNIMGVFETDVECAGMEHDMPLEGPKIPK
jgi:hypothetical protein